MHGLSPCSRSLVRYIHPQQGELLEQPNTHTQLNLYKCTFRPGLEGIAFVGVFRPVPFATIELQARWVARVFAGIQRAPLAPDANEPSSGITGQVAHRQETGEFGPGEATGEVGPGKATGVACEDSKGGLTDKSARGEGEVAAYLEGELARRRVDDLHRPPAPHTDFVPFADSVAREIGALPDWEQLRERDAEMYSTLMQVPIHAAQYALVGPHASPDWATSTLRTISQYICLCKQQNCSTPASNSK